MRYQRCMETMFDFFWFLFCFLFLFSFVFKFPLCLGVKFWRGSVRVGMGAGRGGVR